MQYSLFLWDYDGTLADSHPAIMHCLLRVIEQKIPEARGNKSVADSLRSGVERGIKLELILEEALSALAPAELIEELLDNYRTLYLIEGIPEEQLLPGALAALEAIHARGGVQLIVSNKKGSSIRTALGYHGIDHYFPKVYGSGDQRVIKPDPTLYLEHICNDGYKHPVQKVLMIGDSPTDAAFARNLTMDFCCVDPHELSSDIDSTYRVKELFELLAVLE
jgi:phosphoglycolate phosphatase